MANEMVNVPLDQVGMMAKAVADSGLFGIRNEAQAFTLMCVAQADGIPPIKAVQQYHIIDNKPALKSEAMLARFQAAGGKIRWTERTPQRVSLWLSHPQAGELEVAWDMDRAKAAGLAGKNQWKAYPMQMMGARCISEGIRALYPACLGGCYTPEEVRDFGPDGDEPRPAPQPQPQPRQAETPKPARAKAAKKAERAVEAEVVPETPAAEPAPETAPQPEQAQPAPKPKREPAEMKANFLAWAKSATRTKDPQAVIDALGRLGYESLEQVPADEAALRTVTKAIRTLPDIPAENMEIPF